MRSFLEPTLGETIDPDAIRRRLWSSSIVTGDLHLLYWLVVVSIGLLLSSPSILPTVVISDRLVVVSSGLHLLCLLVARISDP